MVILVDTNVIIDYLAEREGFFEDARKIMEVCATGKVQGCFPFAAKYMVYIEEKAG